MSQYEHSPNPGEEQWGEAACGTRVLITPNTPYIHHRDEIIYFCGQGCKQRFDEDPLNSCLSDRLLLRD